MAFSQRKMPGKRFCPVPWWFDLAAGRDLMLVAFHDIYIYINMMKYEPLYDVHDVVKSDYV